MFFFWKTTFRCFCSVVGGGTEGQIGSHRRLEEGARNLLATHLTELFASIILPAVPQTFHCVDARLDENMLGIPLKLMPSASERETFQKGFQKGRAKLLHFTDIIRTAVKVNFQT